MSSGKARAAIVAAVLLVACGGAQRAAAAPGLHGLVPHPLPVKPSFTLTDTSGKPFAFASRTRGELTYLYFGYTHCPDTCPTTMSDIGAALRRVPASVRQHVAVVFVTVDPRRDTKHVLRTWLDHFGHGFVGLTGTAREIADAQRAAGLPVAHGASHSAFLLPYSPDGRAHVVYTEGFRTTDYAHDMPLLLRF